MREGFSHTQKFINNMFLLKNDVGLSYVSGTVRENYFCGWLCDRECGAV